jgi:ABC-type branched-subunit amino acid transport system substrate-binding protein
LGYDAAKVMFLAIEKAGLDKQKIKEALKTTSYQGVSNPLIEFDENGDLKNPVFEVKIIKNKESVLYQE